MIKNLITSYFGVVKKNINDSVPKSIITFLVNRSLQICERELVRNLYNEKQFDDLLTENAFVMEQRDDTKKVLFSLRNCLNILNDIDSKF